MTKPKSWINQYQSFWLKRVSAASLSLFRVLFGLFVAVDSVILSLHAQLYLPDHPVNFKYPGFSWWPHLDEGVNRYLLTLLTACGLFISIGWLVRLAAVFCVGILLHFLLTEASFYQNHLVLTSLLSVAFAITPSNQYFTLRVFKAGKAGKPGKLAKLWKFQKTTDTTLARYQLFSIVGLFYCSYLFGGLEKLRQDWLKGDILGFSLAVRAQENPVAHWMIESVRSHTLWLPLMAWSTVILEIFAPIGLSWKKSRLPTVLLLALYHGFIGLTLETGLFSYLMVLAFVLYFDPDWPLKKPLRIYLCLCRR